MTDERAFDDALEEVEALVRSARGYVHPSVDLRPRVLETASLERSERSISRSLQRAALFAAMIGWFTLTSIERVDIPDRQWHRAVLFAGDLSASSIGDVSDGDSHWALVDAFSELRRRQAAALHVSF